MTTTDPANLADLERLRQSVEDQIVQLRRSLRYWQIWEAEYEGFKEELERVDHEPSAEEIVGLGSNFGGDIITEREVKDLVRFDQGRRRNRKEVISGINGRISTGQKNAAAIQKQLNKAEEELEKTLAAEGPGLANSIDEQVMEIFEELDEEGNVISARVTNADQNADKIDAALKKAQALDKLTKEEKAALFASKAAEKTITPDASAPEPKATEATRHTETANDRKISSAKSVSFAEKLDQIPADAPNSERWKLLEEEQTAHPASAEVPRILELDENDQVVSSRPMDHLPTSVEDRARHQREVFENASTIGPIVATMDIEEESDYDDDDYEDAYSSESAEENEYGMTAIRNELTPEYIAEMQALMKKHANAMGNIGPQGVGFPLGEALDKIPEPKAPPLNAPEPSRNGKPDAEEGASKSVRFAEELNISEATKQTSALRSTSTRDRSNANAKSAPIGDIVERAPAPISAPAPPGSTKKKMSKFKAAKLGSGV